VGEAEGPQEIWVRDYSKTGDEWPKKETQEDAI